jgi:PPE-repeat protein
MSKTAVGMFKDPGVADQVVGDLEADGFPGNGIRILGEPLDLEGSGATNISNIDFEVNLNRELRAIGATGPEAEAYVQGVRRGGVLVFANGSDEKVDAAVQIMNRHGSLEVEELSGGESLPSSMSDENVTPILDTSVQTGRITQAGGGARAFVW